MTSSKLQIAWPLRAWLAVEVLFGVGAVLSIALSPGDTKTNFAWPIAAVVMAAVLGAFYISSAPLFLLSLFAKRWDMIRVMVLPSALFSSAQLAATFLHWDKFSLGTLPFYLWFASYLLPPPIFISAYIWHQRRAAHTSEPSNDPLPVWLQRALFISGGALLAFALLVFIVPGILIPNFPWPLTPLTARSMCAWLLAVGALMISMANEGDRTRARLGTPMLILPLPVLFLQMLRYSNQVNWSSPVLWVGLIVFGVVGGLGLVLANGSWRKALL